MVKSLLVAAAFAASASAFAPQQQSKVSSTSALNEFANGYVGGEGPEPIFIGGGSENWDPAGLTEVGNKRVVF